MSPVASGLTQAILSGILLVGILALYLWRFSPSLRWAAVALSVCVLDQLAKALVPTALRQHRVSLLGGYLRLTYTENWEQGFGGSYSYLLLATSACVIALFFLYGRLARTRYRMSPLAELGCALMVGGYVGILLDRVRLGFVVDFLEFGRASVFVYNLADLAVFLAVALLVARGLHYLAQARGRRMRLQDEVPS